MAVVYTSAPTYQATIAALAMMDSIWPTMDTTVWVGFTLSFRGNSLSGSSGSSNLISEESMFVWVVFEVSRSHLKSISLICSVYNTKHDLYEGGK